MSNPSTIHASAVLIGPKAVLIRGPTGAGKSRLVWDVLQGAAQGAIAFARLVADDRAHIGACAGRVLVRPAGSLAGLIEIRGLGIRRLPYEPVAAVGLVIDLAAEDAARHPPAGTTTVDDVTLPRLAVGPGQPALPMVLAFFATSPAAA